MEVIMSSPVNECLWMENDKGNAAVKLTKSQKKNRRRKLMKKLNANRQDTENLKSKPDTISLSSLEDNPNTGLATTATVDQKMTGSSAAVTGVEESSVSGMEIDNSNGAVKLTKTQKKNRRKALKKKLNSIREDTENSKSKPEVGLNDVSLLSVLDNPSTHLPTNATVDQKIIMSYSAATDDQQSSFSKSEDHTKVANDEMGSSMTTNLNTEVEVQNMIETENAETVSGTNRTENATSKKRKRRKLKNNSPGSHDISSTCENIQDTEIEKKDSSTGKVLEVVSDVMVSDKTETPDAKLESERNEQADVANGNMGSSMATNLNMDIEVQNKGETATGEKGSGKETENTTSKKRKRKKLKNNNPASHDTLSTCDNTQDTRIAKIDSSAAKVLELVNGEMVSDKNETPDANGEKGSGITATDSTMSKRIGCTQVGNVAKKNQNMEVETFQAATLGKKLLIFDVNGLLADIVSPQPEDIIADLCIRRKAVFKRPFLEDFLCFCFERFNVGIWSSRTKKNLNPVVDCLLGDMKKKLLFIWDSSHCSTTGHRTVEERYKYIVFKDLRKIWENNGPDNAWVKGTFNESNTLLLDDSPYKALLNPKYTGIFPFSYSYKNRDDNFLGPKGELQTYLEGVAGADNVKTYVEQHPLGQDAIDEKNPRWAFYKRVLKSQKWRKDRRQFK